jgi:hypothetical protein
MQSTFVGLSTHLAVAVPGDADADEYILIENSFQFQNLPRRTLLLPGY